MLTSPLVANSPTRAPVTSGVSSYSPKALGRPLDPYTAIWFKLESPPVRRGLNTLGITPLKLDPLDTDEIMIEEVEVGVMPRPVGEEE